MLAEQAVLLEAVAAYTAVVRDRRVLELARGNEERLRLELAATRDRERFGDLTETDIHQAESRHEGGIAERVAAEGALADPRPTMRRRSARSLAIWSRPRCPNTPRHPRGGDGRGRGQLGLAGRRLRPRRGARGGGGVAGGDEAAAEAGRRGRLRRWTAASSTAPAPALRSAPRSPCRSTRAAASMPGSGRARSS